MVCFAYRLTITMKVVILINDQLPTAGNCRIGDEEMMR